MICAACKGPFTSQKDELNCYSEQLFAVVTEHHKPIWLTLLEADMVFLFEDLDVDDNGQIHPMEDLTVKGYPHDIAEKFREEMDGEDEDPTVSLKEFNEYVYEPSVVYALAGCRGQPRGPIRTSCYNEKLKLYITNILTIPVIDSFFKTFDLLGDDEITYPEIEFLLRNSGKVDNFFEELGMGDRTVNRDEFRWFVRQPRVSEMFLARGCGQDTSCLKEVLLAYIQTMMTERDTQKLFGKLDKDGEWDIDSEELLASKYGATRTREEAYGLISKMDHDKDGVVNFAEFRLFFVLFGGREVLERECYLRKQQSGEIDCYEEKLWIL